MDKQVQGLLPFKVGQLAESRSFQRGFRCAWFRCKIREIKWRNGNIEHALEFFDFPGEKIRWTRIYQFPLIGRKKATNIEKMLMLRPKYPPIYHDSQMPQAKTISELTVVNNGEWKVGDLVDWWSDDCYWSGRVTQILGNDKVQIELPPPPVGEGSSYEVFCKDLRPSLDWSPEHGWSVPSSEESKENCGPCARLITPVNQGLLNLEVVTGDDGTKLVEAAVGPVFDASFSPLVAANSTPMDNSKPPVAKETSGQPFSLAIPQGETHRPEPNTDLDMGDSAILRGETNRPEPNTDLDMGDSAIGKADMSHRIGNIKDASAETAGNPYGEDQYHSSGSAKKIRTSGNLSFNCMRSDKLEAPIMDLEELLNKIKWLKSILESRVPLPNAGRPPWKFFEHRA